MTEQPTSAASTHPVFAAADAFVDELCERSPLTATYLGVPGNSDRWDDTSPEGREAQLTFLRGWRQRLADLPPSDGDPWAALAVRTFDEYLRLEMEPIEHGDHERDMGHLQSLFPQLREAFDLMDATTVDGWRAIATRLGTIGVPLAGWRACQERGMAAGRWAARRQAESIVTQLRASVGPEGAFTLLVAGFAEAGVGGDDDLALALSDALAAAGEAVDAAAAWLETDYIPSAPVEDGVGIERYRRHARSFLGADLDLEATYRWGWSHLLDIREAMKEVAAQVEPGRELDEVVASMEQDADTVSDSPEGFRLAMLERERAAMEELAGTHFDIPDQIRAIEVRLAPKGAALGAYFIPPSEDFSRPGTTWWSLGDEEQVAMWDQVSTAYHEGFPGHHLQCGLQVCLGDRLSRVHRLLFWLPGYGEGWALYAERLMHELGYLDKPEYVLGMLASSALRAVRVVIDIGLHLGLPIPDDLPVPADEAFHPGEAWTFDIAVEALQHFAFESPSVARSEITRYLGWPGQAISYKVGERAILELRDESRRREGDDFDLRRFHQRVLGSGPVGLDHLRDIVLADE